MINLIFDYDGTLHESISIYATAFRLAYNHLVSLGKAAPREWYDKEIGRWLGFSAKDMWNSFLPNLSQELKDECSNIIGKEMLRLVYDGKASLYLYAIETLLELKSEGYNLIFLSNCKHAYMQAHIKQFHLDDYFTDFYCTEDYNFMPKYEIFNIIKERHKGEFVIIGDRYMDIEIALKHNLKSIGCGYGYGSQEELSNATVVIENLHDILINLKTLR